MPLKLKRRDGSVTPFRNAEYIPFYYLIPKSYFKRSGTELRSIPYNPQEIFHDRVTCEFIKSDLFKLFIIDATTHMIKDYTRTICLARSQIHFLWNFLTNTKTKKELKKKIFNYKIRLDELDKKLFHKEKFLNAIRKFMEMETIARHSFAS